MKKLLLLVGFFVLTPSLILFNIIFLAYLAYQKDPQPLISFSKPVTSVAYAALPNMQNPAIEEIVANDSRVEIIRQFFAKYGSPLEPYAQQVVDAALRYNIDHRLIPAIAMQESNLCKKIPKDSHNCWGYGIYGKKVTRFSSYEEGIETVSRTLGRAYKGVQGLETPEEIMSRYTPSSNGSWAQSVLHFMNILQ